MSDLRIATITATAHIGTAVDIEALYQNVPIADVDPRGVVYVEYGTSRVRGARPAARAKKACFANQATLLLRPAGPNVKVFRTGTVQMTGLKSVADGRGTVERLAAVLAITPGVGPTKPSPVHIRMIKADFKYAACIRREELHAALLDAGLLATFEPLVFSGVTLVHEGVNVYVFRSGCVSVTGATEEALIRARGFILDFLERHHDAIAQPAIPAPQKQKAQAQTGPIDAFLKRHCCS